MPAWRATTSERMGRRDPQRVAERRDHEEEHRRDEEHEPDDAKLAEHVEPLAVRMLDYAAVLAKTVVREGERAGAGALAPDLRA